MRMKVPLFSFWACPRGSQTLLAVGLYAASPVGLFAAIPHAVCTACLLLWFQKRVEFQE